MVMASAEKNDRHAQRKGSCSHAISAIATMQGISVRSWTPMRTECPYVHSAAQLPAHIASAQRVHTPAFARTLG